MPFDFLGRVDAINPANLTIREQARLAENPNDLRWPSIFPRVPAPSVELSELSTADARFAGGRRSWNAQGREIPEVLGPLLKFEMVPINPTHHIDERAMQKLRERAGGTDNPIYSQGIVKDVDAWATELADVSDRQIEVDAFQAWFMNEITVMDPKTGDTITAPLGFDVARYVAAATTLAAATNAYADFMAYLAEAQAAMGSVGAVRLRRARLNEILADAPATNGDVATVSSLRQRIADNGYGTVFIVVDERTYNGFTDGGSAYGTDYYVPADRMAFQPASGVVGNTHFAPVTRAYDYLSDADEETVQNVTVFHSEKNSGKTLLVEAQANALSLPVEGNVFVVTGLA